MHHIWLDCDPGHDDAAAILLALHTPNIHLVGVSAVHGNTDFKHTVANAARCLYAFGAPEAIKVHPGATKPLLRIARHDPEIHGADGLGGVEGLPPASAPEVLARIAEGPKAIEAIAGAIRETWENGAGEKLTIVASGPLTNIALFVSLYPELLVGVEQIVFMGGGVGVGNRSSVAEFNILCDPEAAQIVLDAPVRKVMIPLNVTHQAIVGPSIQARLLNPSTSVLPTDQASSPLRHTLSTLITFFKDTYRSTFGFTEGPPLHDALTIAYVSRPDLFSCTRYRVDIELEGKHTTGETVADVWGYQETDDTWGVTGKNCDVALGLDVPAFFEFFLECVAKCDAVSPLNAN
ncbi:nucleoside hydrolase [Auriscalpium vulgare]|uniref:Nucleoside hydrolase n=1 Tax=Auriscalpium vulgare TaxID=40419 RepID=A0ACB8SD59_9AGAM|nr:nucleoside hydrolase [Auriscalpium vulgare]